MRGSKDTPLDLNNPADARKFITEALPEALPNKASATEFILADGRTVQVKDLNDSEAVQYAWELLPIYRAAFPELVNTQYEH